MPLREFDHVFNKFLSFFFIVRQGERKQKWVGLKKVLEDLRIYKMVFLEQKAIVTFFSENALEKAEMILRREFLNEKFR